MPHPSYKIRIQTKIIADSLGKGSFWSEDNELKEGNITEPRQLERRKRREEGREGWGETTAWL